MESNISISFKDAGNKTFEFTKLRELYEFAVQERDFWKTQHARVESQKQLHPYVVYFNQFSEVVEAIDGFGEQVHEWDSVELNKNVHRIHHAYLQQSGVHWLWSGNA